MHESAGPPVVEAVAMAHGGDVVGAGRVVAAAATVRLQEGPQLAVAASREPPSAPEGSRHPQQLPVVGRPRDHRIGGKVMKRNIRAHRV